MLVNVVRTELYDLIRKCNFDTVQSVFALKGGTDVGWYRYECESCPISVYEVSTGDLCVITDTYDNAYESWSELFCDKYRP